MSEQVGVQVNSDKATRANSFGDWPEHTPIRGEIFGQEHLEEHGRCLASLCVGVRIDRKNAEILRRFKQIRRDLQDTVDKLAVSAKAHEDFSGGAEWFLDNSYVIVDNLLEVDHDLPRQYYDELPKLSNGPMAGLPRVYVLALELIAHTDGMLDENMTSGFINAFQSVTPLTIGELWAVPIMLRIGLLENLRRLGMRILGSWSDRQEAVEWKEHVLHCKELNIRDADKYLLEPARQPRCSWSDTFVVHLHHALRDHGLDADPGISWLERHLERRKDVINNVVGRENKRQAADQLSIGNAVTGLRLISALDWSAFFERHSHVEAKLRQDPAGCYARQDFATRNWYRHEVELLARHSEHDEVDIANRAVALARQNDGNESKGHVGYYLIGPGRRSFEKSLGYRPSWQCRLQQGMRTHAEAFYLIGISSVAELLIGLAVLYSFETSIHGLATAVLVMLAVLIPASEIAVYLCHQVITRIVPPRILPKMDYRNGVPQDCATFVVIPTLLTNAESGRNLARRLEIHYLASVDQQLRFALLTDFPDAPTETTPEEEAWLAAAIDQIRQLNAKYAAEGPDRFFLVHRKRRWNPGMHTWMGWERKRGKLIEFNRLLAGDRSAACEVVAGNLSGLPSIRYVITLDTDTRLPREVAGRLIGTLNHPLNRPQFDPASGRVIEGYGVLQPRVNLAMTSKDKSWFARIFGDSLGLDPYTTAVSDIYQDLFGRGSFTGKGIYDVRAFEAAAANVFPDNQILSHDLIEGNYARCGLVTDIELLDEFPSNYLAYARREHRWIRGDWQILPWLFHRVRGRDGNMAANPLPWLERWKIFDNLRRSLVAPALVCLLILGWTLLPGSPWLWTLSAIAVPFLPVVAFLVHSIVGMVKGGAWRLRARELAFQLKPTAGQACLGLVFLLDQAWLDLDAVVRTLWRHFVSRKYLLEWETAAATERRLGLGLGNFIQSMALAPVTALVCAGALFHWQHTNFFVALPILVAWFLSPFLAFVVSQPHPVPKSQLTDEQKRELRLLARRTWLFFQTFVTAEDHWLPPDNYQEDPKGEVAHRTSPTNIGCYLVSVLSAHDLGYLSLEDAVARLENTFNTLQQLDHRHGHPCNWYDTQTLKPLPPIYLSTVDSGNLLACLIVVRRLLANKLQEPPLGPSVVRGLQDSLELARRALRALGPTPARSEIKVLKSLEQILEDMAANLTAVPQDLSGWRKTLSTLEHQTASVNSLAKELTNELGEPPEDFLCWCEQLTQQTESQQKQLRDLYPWLEHLIPARAGAPGIDSACGHGHKKLLVTTLSPRELQTQKDDIAAAIEALTAELDTREPDALNGLKGSISVPTGADLIDRVEKLVSRIQLYERQMDFKVLFNAQRCLFAVGFNDSSGKLDNAHYDLLASEACLTSFLAIARGEAPRKHWFQLGRPLARAPRGITLISWGGTMFEYLMPRLFLKPLANTLLDESWHGAVDQQIAYGKSRHVPWGISESGYHALDSQLNYQYQAFGVPTLGLKRGLARDLVIAPYATMLALAMDPNEAEKNLCYLKTEEALGTYGFYEALDYSRDQQKDRRSKSIVRSYMAHHQGMGLIALTNCLLDDPVPRCFHAEPMVRATELLLQERVPSEAGLATPQHPHEQPLGIVHESTGSVSRRLTSADTPHPRVHLLSNGRYGVMVSNSGSGWSVWRDLDVTRWREDRVLDRSGQFFYIRDLWTGKTWSAARQPVNVLPDEYEVIFAADKATFRRVDGSVETHLEITVSPENDAEVRRLMLTNHSRHTRDLEVTSYAEIVLLPHRTDAAHPAFGKLFMKTEYIAEHTALICERRPRSPEEKPVWAVHVLALEEGSPRGMAMETDRARFLGRGRTVESPRALDAGAPLMGALGPVLDPILSLRCRVRVPPGSSVSMAFTTAVAANREQALTLADHYQHFPGVTRAFELAWAHSQVQLRHLNITPEEVCLYQRLAAHVAYAGPVLRRADAIQRNHLGQQDLWKFGVSGDLPIVLMSVVDESDIQQFRQVLLAHGFWRLKGLRADLVVLNDHAASYRDELHDQVQMLIRASAHHAQENKPGGIHLLRGAQVQDEDRTLLYASAQAIFEASRGSLTNQVERQFDLPRLPSPLIPQTVPESAFNSSQRQPHRLPEASPDTENLLFWNGHGGFSQDGREYVIVVHSHTDLPPAPWSNVIANPGFGTLVTEAGSSCTWADNSQQFRLTPWSNDPVSDPSGEILYLRDEETGEFWTPTPLPLGEGAITVIRHGQGYSKFTRTSHGLSQELTLLVDPTDPVKLIKLRIRNVGSRVRHISAYFYVEWVLGNVRDQAIMHAHCERDAQSGALLCRNGWFSDYAKSVCFAAAGSPLASHTTDRLEFFGRNGSVSSPAALYRTKLSNRIHPLADPCAVLHVDLQLDPGQEKEVVFLLGKASGPEQVRELVDRHRSPENVAAVLQTVSKSWNAILGAVSVKTHDPAFDLLMNRWLIYQALSSRVWGRTAFYQSSGAYGFRDQLQDVLALLHAAPAEARSHILRAAGRQFQEGDVQHWWHPPAGRGVRTRITDDFLWLPFAVSTYVVQTGDHGILDEQIPFLYANALREDQDEDYGQPGVSTEVAPLYVHCRRALERGFRLGSHGLPLMGTGDWNDGMNRVGVKGTGESIWLGWFQIKTLREFAPLAEQRGDQVTARLCVDRANLLAGSLEENGWDGSWYRRAYFDDGTPLGSALNTECQIDSIAQSWAVMAGSSRERMEAAMGAVQQKLVHEAERLILLLTPPFAQGSSEPGYIKGYLPGVRENGGQYTHAATWVVLALALLKQGARAGRMFDLLNPIKRTTSPDQVNVYHVEPYVLAGDICSEPPNAGRGGWTWYTGSAGWLYRVGLENILGIEKRGNTLHINPCVAPDWKYFQVTYRLGTSTYTLSVHNPSGAETGVKTAVCDGNILKQPVITLEDDGKNHDIQINM